MIYVRCNSHRARERACRALGLTNPQNYYSWQRSTGRGCFQVAPEQWAVIRSIPGVTRLRGPYGDLRQCIDWGGKGGPNA